MHMEILSIKVKHQRLDPKLMHANNYSLTASTAESPCALLFIWYGTEMRGYRF